MKKYLENKLIKAKPMNRGNGNEYRVAHIKSRIDGVNLYCKTQKTAI